MLGQNPIPLPAQADRFQTLPKHAEGQLFDTPHLSATAIHLVAKQTEGGVSMSLLSLVSIIHSGYGVLVRGWKDLQPKVGSNWGRLGGYLDTYQFKVFDKTA